MIKKIIKWFLKKHYEKKPLERVEYYQKNKAARARLMEGENGEVNMDIIGEKYPFPGHPRGYVLFGSLAKLKLVLKRKVFNVLHECLPDMIPPEKMCPFVKELWEKMELLEHAEITEDMKSEIKNLKRVICFFLQEDDSYRMRAQWVLGKLDMKKCKLSKADKYYLRGKWFKADYGDPKNIFNAARNEVLY